MELHSQNFGFLEEHEPALARYGALAEHYFAIEPRDTLVKIRQMAEQMAKLAAARMGAEVHADDDFVGVLITLRERGMLAREANDVFHLLRREGNAAVHDHDTEITHGRALHALKAARALAIWFRRTVTADPDFNPGPFVPPQPPEAADTTLREQIAELQSRLDEHRAARTEAERMVEEYARAADEAREESATWEQLAHEAEERIIEAARTWEVQLTDARRVAAETSADRLALVTRTSLQAGEDLDLDESDTRRLIDSQLREVGWQADSELLRHSRGARPAKGANRAIAEWPTESGPADYVLFLGLTPVAVVEAKRRRTDVPGALGQSKRYASGLRHEGCQLADGAPWGEYRAPFLFASNGRPYLKQLETASGIWFLDARRAENHPRALDGWYSPEGFAKELTKDIDAAEDRLEREPTDYLPLRDYQVAAIRSVEHAVAGGRRTALLAMATGTGKTRTCIGLIYRLIKTGRFRRVLFLVDRTALGEQAANAFKDVKLEQLQSLTDIYDVKELGDLTPDSDTRVQIATIQGMMQRLLFPSEGDSAVPVDRYDCIVVDECHRGYTLDREMTDAELRFRSETDYISKYRRVVDHFDSVKVGLTATPALHTTEIFGRPVFEYGYRQAVIDGWLIDHEPPVRIVTRLAKEGIHWARGDEVTVFDPASAQLDLFETPDDLDFDIDTFNREVVTESFNRVVCDELTTHIDPGLEGKTLVFCATDAHADMVVHLLKRAFDREYGGIPDDAIAKITGAADRPSELIRRFKNERDPRIAVTVDLLTTGIDVPEITSLVFLRRVRSRILYEQMLGRATRRCDDIDKTVFRIFDAVDIYSILQPVTTMKPVVTGPFTTFEELVNLIRESDDEQARQEFFDQLVAKLQRKRGVLDRHHGEDMRSYTGGSADTLTGRLRAFGPAAAADYLADHPALLGFLDSARAPGERRYISDHVDERISVEHGYGLHDNPGDYIDAFAAFIRDHLNDIPALLVVTQRPRDLTREQLRELLLALDEEGYTESILRTAWRDHTNEDIAASIIGFIRNRALGSPLVPYEQRVDRAVREVLASGTWTDPQRRWLERIAAQLKKETIVDRDALDSGEFRRHGGFNRLNRVFGGRLEAVLRDLRAAIWEEAS